MTTPETALPTWTIDPVHSRAEFSLEYMGISVYRTGFRTLEGTLRFDPANPARGSVTASIPVASIDVTNERLLGRLMDDDLLAGREHPAITFQSTGVEPAGSDRWTVRGDLTIRGVTRPVALDTRFGGLAKHPFSGKMATAFRAETAVDRGDFGVTWNAKLDTGGPYLGERVQISLVVMAARQE